MAKAAFLAASMMSLGKARNWTPCFRRRFKAWGFLKSYSASMFTLASAQAVSKAAW
jgi:hypothetical protein